MQWIRENLFLTCVTGALVVCFGVAYTIRSGQDTAFVEKDMRPRIRLASRIRDLSRSEPITKEWLKKAQDRLKKIRGQRDKIVREVGDWNKKSYSVLKLKVITNGVTEVFPAFPYDSAVYQTKDLTSKFTNADRVALYGALARLDLTSWPTDVEIGELSVKIEKDIQSRRKAAVNRVDYANRRSGAPAPKPPAGDGKPPEEAKKPKGITQEDWDLSRLTDADVSKMARRNATEELMLQKANAGIMFVSPRTLAMVSDLKLPGGDTGPEELDVVFPKEVWKSADAPAGKLWEAQLNLWITQDILTAIDMTNQQSLRTAGSVRKATVPNAAVKRLDGINITEQYLMQRDGANEGDQEADLTQRVTTSEYEIVEYELQVVMKTSYLPTMMRNLMMRGDHTVTNVTIRKLPVEPAGMQYYGTDPVATVLVTGDVLFRSSWTRKIMPSETLKNRLSSVPGIPGPKDNKPLKQEGQ